MSLERIVRPFQLNDVTPARRVESAYAVDPQPIKLLYGRSGSGKMLGGSVSFTQTFYMDTKLKETKAF